MVVGCAIFAPFITRGFPPELVAFLLVLQIAAVPSHARPGWSPVTLAAGVPPLLASLIGSLAFPHHATLPNTVAAAGAGLVGIVVALVSARRRERDPVALGLLAASAVPTLVAASLLTKTPAALVAAAVAVAFAGVAAGRRWWPGPAADITAGVALVAALQATVTAFDGTARATILLGEAVVLLLVALRAEHRVALFGAIALGSIGALLALSGDASLVPVVMYRVRRAGQLSAAAAEAVLIVVNAVALPWVAYRFRLLRAAAENLGPWLAAGAVALYGAATGILAAAELVPPGRAGFFLGHVLVTVSWTATALVLLVRGVDAVLPRVVGLVLVGAAVLKLVTFDLSELDGIARVTVFLGAGLILLFAGTRYARLVRVRQPGADDPATE